MPEQGASRPVKVRRKAVDFSGPSIKDALSGRFEKDRISAKEQHEIFHRAEENEAFSPEQLKVKWEDFVERLTDRPNLQSTLSTVPVIEEDCKLILTIDNSVQDDLIAGIRPELVSWLRKALKNSRIQLVTQITEGKKERVIYTDSEKYSEMLKKNPRLELLKKRFKLDFGD